MVSYDVGRNIWQAPAARHSPSYEGRLYKYALRGRARVTRYDPISIWEIDMSDRYGRSDINGISIGISISNMGYQFGIRYVDMLIYHIDMVVILDIDMQYGLMIWEMIVSKWSSPISILDILSLWAGPHN